jgi:hypothetical protein
MYIPSLAPTMAKLAVFMCPGTKLVYSMLLLLAEIAEMHNVLLHCNTGIDQVVSGLVSIDLFLFAASE